MILDVGCGKDKAEIEGEKVIGIDFRRVPMLMSSMI